MSRLSLQQWHYAFHDVCKKNLCHHQILFCCNFIIFCIKKPTLKGAGRLNIFKKYQYGSLTPNLRKKTPPRKPYCICFFHHSKFSLARNRIFLKKQNIFWLSVSFGF